MNTLRDRAALILAVISLGASVFLFLNRPGRESSKPNQDSALAGQNAAVSGAVIAELRENLRLLSDDLAGLERVVGDAAPASPGDNANPESSGEAGASGTGPPPFASIDQRIRTLEQSLARLQSNYEGLSIEGASAERAELFASDEGAIKADEYFEAGKHSIAAEGYLTYYRNHPDDPDAEAVLNRARSAYTRAGYSDMAIWVQEEKMRIFPENRVADLKQLAAMNKNSGNYDAAVAHAAESAELTTNAQERLWTRLYWAWYNQLRDGPDGGLDAYLEVQREIEAAGYADHRLGNRAQEKIEEIRREIAGSR